MALQYKCDVLAKLKEAGYNTNKLRKDKLMGESTIQMLRNHEMVSLNRIEQLCKLLKVQPGDLLVYIPDDPEEQE